jgi:hypothetical protein
LGDSNNLGGESDGRWREVGGTEGKDFYLIEAIDFYKNDVLLLSFRDFITLRKSRFKMDLERLLIEIKAEDSFAIL